MTTSTSSSLMFLNKSLRSHIANANHSHVRYFSVATKTKTTETNNPAPQQLSYTLTHSPDKIQIPALGFGTWGNLHFDNAVMSQSTYEAIKIGYRHIDCARRYYNEKDLGEVLKTVFAENICTREELFITSKLFNDEHSPSNAPRRALESTLQDLQLDYVDSFLMHYPFRMDAEGKSLAFDMPEFGETWKLMHELQLQKLTKSVGVSNTTVHKLQGLMSICDVEGLPYPSMNQVELHPYLQQPQLLEFCTANSILLAAAMPLGSPERPKTHRRDNDPILLEDEVIAEVAREVGGSVAQVIIRWHLQRGCVTTPKATEERWIRENLGALEIRLTEEQMSVMGGVDRRLRLQRAEMYSWKVGQAWQEMWDNE